jgi:hypothetical protein
MPATKSLGAANSETANDGPLALPLPQGGPMSIGFDLAFVEFYTLLKGFLCLVILVDTFQHPPYLL